MSLASVPDPASLISSAAPEPRCVAHPGRPAVDRCPRCGRPRCGADATGPRCAVCGAAEQVAAPRELTAAEVVVRAALGATAVALPAGWVLSEYVSSPLLQYLAPVVVGVACAGAATWAARDPRGPVRPWVRLVAVLYAVLGTALGFVLEGTYGVLSADLDVLVPYAAAAGGAWLWSAPPRRRT